MNLTLPLLLSAWLPLFAAQDAPPDLPQPSDEALDRLDELDDEVAEFTRAWGEEQQERAKEAAAKAKKEGLPMSAFAMRPDYAEFAERLMGWADDSGGEDAALYLTKAVVLAGVAAEETPGRRAFDRLVREHPASPSWTRLGHMLQSAEQSLGVERRDQVFEVLRRSPVVDVRGWVVLATHANTIEKAALDSAEYAASRTEIVAYTAQVSDAELRHALEGVVALREKFGIGAQAPDIAGIDLDGNAFKLSDYRGKVLFLDFWGDW